MPLFTTGKCILSLVNFITMTGAFIADWNETHIYNPAWPPHARYHNGQTMSTGLFIGLVTFYILFAVLPGTSSAQLQIAHLNSVLLLQGLFYLSSLSGILYPGAMWMDPEFGHGRPQLYGFSVLMGVAGVGWWIERRRVLRGEGLGLGVGKRE